VAAGNSTLHPTVLEGDRCLPKLRDNAPLGRAARMLGQGAFSAGPRYRRHYGSRPCRKKKKKKKRSGGQLGGPSFGGLAGGLSWESRVYSQTRCDRSAGGEGQTGGRWGWKFALWRRLRDRGRRPRLLGRFLCPLPRAEEKGKKRKSKVPRGRAGGVVLYSLILHVKSRPEGCGDKP